MNPDASGGQQILSRFAGELSNVFSRPERFLRLAAPRIMVCPHRSLYAKLLHGFTGFTDKPHACRSACASLGRHVQAMRVAVMTAAVFATRRIDAYSHDHTY